MGLDRGKLVKANEILLKMASGVNPMNGEQIEEGSFLHDPRMIRCLYFVREVLDKAIDGQLKVSAKKLEDFVITAEEIGKIELPKGRIGVNEFAKCVNRVIDPSMSRRVSGMELNRRLKRMGVLEEEQLEGGKTRTRVGAGSREYGIETEMRNYNGNEYEMILFNETGKKFLLDNLEAIMTVETDSPSPAE